MRFYQKKEDLEESNYDSSTNSALLTFGIMSLVFVSIIFMEIPTAEEEERKERYMKILFQKEKKNPLFKKTKNKHIRKSTIETHKAFNVALKEEDMSEKYFVEEINKLKKKYKRLKESNKNFSKRDSLIKKSKKSVAFSRKILNSSNKKQQGNIKNSSVIYYLEKRRVIELPSPVYTCLKGGRITVDIKVDRYGEVVFTRVNYNKSTSNNGCLIDNALTYAKKTRFDMGKDMQEGYITFIYFSK